MTSGWTNLRGNMVFQRTGRSALDYHHCRYGESRLVFRGPKAVLDRPYIACIGGSATYGRFVADPFPSQISARLAVPVANLGVVNSGIDAFVHDPTIVGICSKAAVTIIQATPPGNMSNRLYSVHPRRNDRFIKPSTLLETIFNDIDFTDIHFTGHLLATLQSVSSDRFGIVAEELRTAWIARMKLLLERIDGEVILFSVVDAQVRGNGPGPSDVNVDRAMLTALAPWVRETLSFKPSAEAIKAGTDGMVFDSLDAAAASRFPNPVIHNEIASTLTPLIETIL